MPILPKLLPPPLILISKSVIQSRRLPLYIVSTPAFTFIPATFDIILSAFSVRRLVLCKIFFKSDATFGSVTTPSKDAAILFILRLDSDRLLMACFKFSAVWPSPLKVFTIASTPLEARTKLLVIILRFLATLRISSWLSTVTSAKVAVNTLTLAVTSRILREISFKACLVSSLPIISFMDANSM